MHVSLAYARPPLALYQEILAIMVSLSTFTAELRERKIILFSDNEGQNAHMLQPSAIVRCCRR